VTDRNSRIYPNADSNTPTPRFPDTSRRALLTGSAVAGAVLTAGCLGDDGDDGTSETDDTGGTENSDLVERPTVFVFNTESGTVSIIDVETDDVVRTASIGMTASFPSNQYTPGFTDSGTDSLWLDVDRGVRAVSPTSFEQRAVAETGSGANWLEQTPDGNHLVVSAREPAHKQVRIDADEESETFGEGTGEIERASEGGRGDNDGPGPCDVTIHPDGEYAYVPDLFGDTLTVLSIDPFEIQRQVEVDANDDVPPEPWMGTATWDGEMLLVENNTGNVGSESIWDVRNPGMPVEQERLTPDDGLGEGPLTSEIGPDSEVGYVFTPGTDDVSVVDLVAGTVEDRLDLGGSAFVGTWDSNREKLYIPVQSTDEVAIVDHERREIVKRIDVGPAPYGATATKVRPSDTASIETAQDTLKSMTGTFETTYCLGECACGHEL
jgi:YVTN family beta-propeller protein